MAIVIVIILYSYSYREIVMITVMVIIMIVMVVTDSYSEVRGKFYSPAHLVLVCMSLIFSFKFYSPNFLFFQQHL